MYSPLEAAPTPDSSITIPEEQINLDPPAVQPDQVDLDAPGQDQLPDEKVAATRAVKAHIAFGGDSPGPEQLLAEIQSGSEKQMRQRLATAKEISLRQMRLDVIKNVAAEKAKKGQMMTQDDADFIAGLSEDKLSHDPSTILETEYARQYFNKVAELCGTKNIIQAGFQKDTDATAEEMDVASGIKSRMEVVKTEVEGLNRRWANTGWGSALASYAGQFIPLLENIRLHDSKGESILPGANLQERVQRLWTMPPADFTAQFRQDLKELEALNPLTASRYAHAVLAYSTSDAHLDSAFGILDASTIPVIGAGKAVVKAVRGAAVLVERQGVKQALKDTVKADATVEPKPLETLLAQGGDLEASAKFTTFKDAAATFQAQDPLGEGGRLRAAVPTLNNPLSVLEGSENLGREAQQRLASTLLSNATDLIKSFTATSRVARLEEGTDALRIATEKAWSKLQNAYPHLGDAVLDMKRVRAEELASNVHMAEMQLGKSERVASELATPSKSQVETSIGKPDATLFTGERAKQEAEYWATNIYKLDPNAYKIKQQGVGYYLSVRGPISEVEDEARDALITTGHQTPQGVFNTFLGRLRTAEDTLSESNRTARHVATHGVQELHRLAQNTAKQIGVLPNKSIKRLDAFLAANRDEFYSEGDQVRRGVFYQNVGEFDRAWTNFHKKAPTEQERTAYFSAVQLNDWDYVFRNLGLVRDKSRLGIERFAFWHQVTDETSGEKALVKTLPMDGRIVDDVPWDDTENAGLWVYDGKSNIGKYYDKNGIPAEAKADILNKIKTEGYKVVQVANPIDKPIRKIADNEEAIHFIVVPAVDRTPLDWKQLKYRPGGHVEYQFENWTKQPVIRRTQDGRQVYEGDQAIFNHATEAEAVKFSKAMETARVMLKDNKLEELKDFLPSNLPYDVDSFTALFKEVTLQDGTKVPPRLSLSDPIRHTVSGQNLLDFHPDITKGYDKFENQVRSSYNLYGQIDKKYASSRDVTLGTVRERAEGNNTLFKLEASKLINPLSTLDRAMANIMRGRHLADYKHKSVEQFIQEFGDLLKVEGGIDEIRKNPVYYLHNAPWNTQTPDKAKLAAGMNMQRAVISLLGTESELGQNLGWVQRQLMGSIYNKLGQGTSDFVAEHMLPVVQDPFRYARAVAFHSKLGLFNPVQLFLQMQTLVHVTAVSGLGNGTRGLSAATLMSMLRLTENPKVVDHFANMATKMGWKKADFLESYAAMKQSGIFNVEGEVATRDYFGEKLFKGAAGTFLDKGTFFFREGERITRLTAWNAAYREWKVANPGKVLDNAALGEILLRQNTLSVNMTRASSAWWQQGLLSMPTQFFAYQARLMEQFLGKRLTEAEKARAFLTYAAVYGVPTATGAATFAWPWYEDMRQSALERGIDVSAPGHKAILEGIPSMLMGLITGNEQNFAQRLGPGGVQYFKEVFEKGKVLELFGASPKIVLEMTKAVAPVMKAVISPFVPGMGDWKLTSADAITALSEISTVNNVGKAIYALNTHKFITKNEIDLGPATTADALMTAMIGTQPLRQTDAFLIADMATEQKKLQDAAKKEIVKNWRRAMREFDSGNDAAAFKYLNNMRNQIVGAGYRPDQLPAVMKEATQGYESFLDKMNKKYLQSAPADQYRDRFNRLFKMKPDEESK